MAGTNYFTGPARRPAGDPILRARDERLESLKAVVGKLAHDFNNFLVPQFGYLTLVSEEIPAETSAAQYLRTMESAARAAEGYIESVLLAVRPQRQYAPRDLDLAALLSEALELWTATLPKDVEMTIESDIQPAPLHGDERHWRKLVEHLLSNARFALAFGGKLRLSLRPAELANEEMLRLGVESPDVYELRVEDAGIGMSEATLGRAFDPFFTTRPIVRGSGLGLTIIHTVTQFHGGQVELDSAENRGTTFTLWIPRTAPTAVRAGAAALLRRGPKKRKVLLVEDDPIAEQVLRAWLTDLDFDIHAAETPSGAAKLLGRDPRGFAIVVSEAALKAGPLAELEQTVEANSVPCLLLAARDEASHAKPTLKKPFSKELFSATVKRLART